MILSWKKSASQKKLISNILKITWNQWKESFEDRDYTARILIFLIFDFIFTLVLHRVLLSCQHWPQKRTVVVPQQIARHAVMKILSLGMKMWTHIAGLYFWTTIEIAWEHIYVFKGWFRNWKMLTNLRMTLDLSHHHNLLLSVIHTEPGHIKLFIYFDHDVFWSEGIVLLLRKTVSYRFYVKNCVCMNVCYLNIK